MLGVIRYVLKKFYLICAVLLIALAVLVQLGRSFSHLANDYHEELADYLSRQLDVPVSVGAIEVQWEGLMPVLDAYDVRLSNRDDDPILSLDHARLRLDILSSVSSFRPIWGTLTLDGARLSFFQNSAGRWGIAGLPESDAEEELQAAVPRAVQPDDVYDVFLLGEHVEFQRSHLTFHFSDGHSAELFAPSLLLENSGTFHRLSLRIALDNRPGTAHLVLEGDGNPGNRRQFRSRGYLEFQEFPTTEPLAALWGLLFDGAGSDQLHAEGTLDARLWFNSRPGGEGYDLNGALHLQELPIPAGEHYVNLHHLQTRVHGSWLRNGHWHLALQDLSLEWNNSQLDDISLGAFYRGQGMPLQLQLAEIDLERWHSQLQPDLQRHGTETLQNVFSSLQPRGQLQRVRLQLPLDNPKQWRLTANLRDVAVDSWSNVPAFTNVNGFVQADMQGGFVDLRSDDGFSMYFADVYAQAMEYRQARGQVAWWLRPDDNRIYVNSGPLQLTNDGESATGYLWLALPWEINSGDIDLYLHIGGRNMTAGLYSKYVPQLVPQTLRHWLDESVGTQNPGVASSAGFIFRGTLNAGDEAATTYQLALDVDGANLRYHTDWPMLREVSGRLLLDNNRVEAVVNKSRLYNSLVRDARVQVNHNPEGEGMLLRVDGVVDGIASDGIRVLRESWLRNYVGDHLDAWYLHGNMLAQLELAIPLQPGEPGLSTQLVVDIDAPTLNLDNYDLRLSQVKGRLRYSDNEGLRSESLTGQMFGHPLTVTVESEPDTQQRVRTVVGVEGAVASEELARWSNRPEILFLDGTVNYNGRVELFHDRDPDDADALTAALSFSSDLEGVRVNLPDTYGKSPDESRSLLANYVLGGQTALLDVRYGDLLHGVFQLQRESQRLLNATVAVHDRAVLASEPQFQLRGNLPSLDIDSWREVIARYSDYSVQLGGDPEQALAPAVEQLPLRLSMTLGEHELGRLRLHETRIDASREDDVWSLEFFNDVLGGRLLLPPEGSEQPMQLSLDYLHLTREALRWGAAEDDVAEDTDATPFDPRLLPGADVRVAELTLDGDDFGDWSFSMRPGDDGLVVRDINGNIRGLSLAGEEDEDGAILYWFHDDRGTYTRIAARAEAGDMAAVLQSWSQPDILNSRSARYDINVGWSGAPHEFALTSLEGSLQLSLQQGSFRRDPSAGDGILRLLSLLNFDSLARRLRLDFSDLYQSGLAYDEVRGQVRFSRGMMYFDEPLQVRSPSSRMQLGGSVNLEQETIDARLVATLPVAGNLTFLAALAAGLPTAVGVYVVSKLFERQVDQATSVTYSIRGSWDDPQMRFDRMFESDANLRSNGDN